jgi:hypothetical protein
MDSKSKNISLEKALEAYRAKHVPVELTWKQHFVNEVFSSDNALELQPDEKKQYVKRLVECNVSIFDSIKATKDGHVCTLLDLLKTLIDEKNKNVTKINRKVIYSTSNGERPIGKTAFDLWNGFQVIDMDIKDETIAKKLKVVLFERLKKYNWFVGIALSSSGKGLHVYTKIQVSENERKDDRTKKIAYLTNFRHKYSFVYLICINAAEEIGFTKEQLLKWMDLAMFKPQQGAFIGYDPNAMFSTHFFEDFLYMNFDNVEDMGHPEVDWVTYPDLKEVFKRWEWFEASDDNEVDVEVKDAPDLEVNTHSPVHYKHFERWRLANTLVKLYGQEKGYIYLRMICSGVKAKELQSDCITASRHNKPIDVWAVNRLNTQHGFKIKLNISQEETNVQDLCETIDNIENPTLLRESPNTYEYHIKANEYLGNIKWQLLKDCGMITLIEAGAGVGKTEMVKSLVRDGKRVMMVMPFTSTIKSKVENVDKWQFAYGNKKVRLDTGDSIALTVDKFSRMNLMELKESGFDYIFLDESHLLFQSEYRSVMPKVIEMIRNTQVPIIMMSGTPVGETVFFDDIVHLKVIKEETRKKEFHVVLTDRPDDNFNHMVDRMARDIVKGKRILFPTNKGTLYKAKLEAQLVSVLETKYGYTKKIIVNYYKKSNVGEKFMDDVNVEKTIKKTTVLLCSTYLSVGVDILDRYDFNIYFNELWMPQEIEQFANRLRSHDLFIYLFLNKCDADGNSLGITSFKPLNMKYSDEEKKFYKSVIDLCNGMLARNPVEFKYNSLISSFILQNKFIEYNGLENKYYVNDIAYKTIYFERKYREYVQQLPVLTRGMKSYGYLYSSEDIGIYRATREEMLGIKSATEEAQASTKALQTLHAEELMDLITEDRLTLYRDVVGGRYELIKSDKWEDDIINKKIYVKDMEIFDKVVPMFVSMSKLYEPTDIREIFNFCRNTNGTFNYAAIERMRTLINMVYNNKAKRLDMPIQRFMEKTYEFAEQEQCKRVEIDKFVNKFAFEYMKAETQDVKTAIYLSEIVAEQVKKSFMTLFNCLINVTPIKKSKGQVKLKKIELMWKTREEKESEIYKNQNVYVLAEFLEHVQINKTVIDNG